MKFNIEPRFFYHEETLAHISSHDSFNHGFDKKKGVKPRETDTAAQKLALFAHAWHSNPSPWHNFVFTIPRPHPQAVGAKSREKWVRFPKTMTRGGSVRWLHSYQKAPIFFPGEKDVSLRNKCAFLFPVCFLGKIEMPARHSGVLKQQCSALARGINPCNKSETCVLVIIPHFRLTF